MCCNVACVYHGPTDSALHLQATDLLSVLAVKHSAVICYSIWYNSTW